MSLRFSKFSELYIATGFPPFIKVRVYNSFPSYPDEDWVFNVSSIGSDFRSKIGETPLQIFSSGARYWTVDAIESATTKQPFVTFGGFKGKLVAEFKNPTMQRYSPVTISSDTICTFEKSKQVYILSDPSGNYYIMQSFTQSVEPSLTSVDLPSLKNKLSLPQGWNFFPFTLGKEENFKVGTDNKQAIIVIQDDLGNTYQKLTLKNVNYIPPFMQSVIPPPVSPSSRVASFGSKEGVPLSEPKRDQGAGWLTILPLSFCLGAFLSHFSSKACGV